MSKKEHRRLERELALYGIFGMEFNEEKAPAQEILENFVDEEQTEKLKQTNGNYAQQVMEAFDANREEIDQLISKYLSKNWSLDNIAKIDKAILRLAITEMLYTEEPVPREIAINEAIELTKRYAQEESRKYINALLSHLMENEAKD